MVNLTDIVTDGFLQRYTEWKSLEEFEQNSPLNLQDEEYWQFINKPEFNQYISDHSEFMSWNSLLKRATQEFIAKHSHSHVGV